ncbi:MAG: acetyl-CoA carboxylase biotin carboxyl carrier protein [Casimicrobiaceae bacterium]
MSESTKITAADLEAILKLVQSAEHLGDFHLKYGDLELRVSRSGGGTAAEAVSAAGPGPVVGASTPATARPGEPAAPAFSPAQVPPPKGARAADAVAEGMAVVKAPMVGTFYRSPAPGAKSFVEVGDRVAPDTVVCIIEVMKLMNTIHADVTGTVREIRVANSEPVGFGQVLLVIEPDR